MTPDERSGLEPTTAPEPLTAEERTARQRSLLARILGPLAVAGAVLLKVGSFAKFAGIFVAFAAYALIWGWKWGVGLIGLILVHELGHFFEARRQGLRPQLPVFIPFLGAYVALRGVPFDPWRNALVTLAGPIVGGLGALSVFIVGEATDSRLLLALAYSGFFLNLINMIPVGFLDGGHIVRAWRVLRRGGGRKTSAEAVQLGWVVAALAIGTCAALAAGMWASHVPQDRL